MDEFITACPRNCYSTCTFIVQTENKRIRRILPFKNNRATPEGPCIKGLSYIERAHSEARIKHPLIKDKNGAFRTIEMSEALDIAAARLAYFKDKYGPQSILWYRGSGNSGLANETGNEFWSSFGGATTTYGNLCWPAGLEAVRVTLGSVKHNVPWDLKNARTIIIWGKNPAETNIQEMAFINAARDSGCRVIVIDLRRTITADKADLFICPAPGTDGALALGIAYAMVEKGLINREFIDQNVYGYGSFVDNLSITPHYASEITGVPISTIHQLASVIGNGEPVTILPGYGLQRHMNGGQTIRSLLALAVISGNLGKPGAGFNYANLQGYVFDKVKEPLSYYPDKISDKPFRRSISMTRLGRDMLDQREPELKAVWVERGNPIIQSPDSTTVRKAFEQLEFRVVIEQFMTDTALLADLIFPAKDIFEQSDIVSSYWSPYVQFKPKILDPEGEITPESEIYYHLASRLKLNASGIPEPGNASMERWLEERIKGYTGLKLSDLKLGPVIAPGLSEIAYSDLKFETPSGKIELFSGQAATDWNVCPLPEYRFKQIPEKEKFPVVLITPNTGNRIHSQFGNLDIMKEIIPLPVIEISPADAEIRKISTGDRVKIFNGMGEFITTAGISDRLPAGIASFPNGIWLSEGGGCNRLISPKETDMGYGAAFHDTCVEIEKVDQ